MSKSKTKRIILVIAVFVALVAVLRVMPRVLYHFIDEKVTASYLDGELYAAVSDGDVEEAKKLLEFGANPNHENNGETMLQIANRIKNQKLIFILKKYGAR